jgi:hypothetical protein
MGSAIGQAAYLSGCPDVIVARASVPSFGSAVGTRSDRPKVRYGDTTGDADTSGVLGGHRNEEGCMRQWELFGITDDDPYWTPPPAASRPIETVRFVPDIDDEDDVALVPEPAA